MQLFEMAAGGSRDAVVQGAGEEPQA